MSYHDKFLIAPDKRRKLIKGRYFRAFVRGINDLTLKPGKVELKFGTPEDDWRAVGADMRRVIERLPCSE